MIVYVESNFVLELALEQEESPAAQSILQLAEEKKIDLAFPALALYEPHWKIEQRSKERQQLHESIRKQLRELQRSGPHQYVAAGLESLLPDMLRVNKSETDNFEVALNRLLATGRSLDLTEARFRQSLTYRTRHDLSLQDSVIFAVIIADLQQHVSEEVKCFISRDARAFDDPDVKSELGHYQCRYLRSFRDGLGFIQSNLAAAT